jgi:hypothetical protein
MIPAKPAQHPSRCSPAPATNGAVGWVQPTGVNSAERSPTDATYQTLTCRNRISAGQHGCLDNVDTEAVSAADAAVQREGSASHARHVKATGRVAPPAELDPAGEVTEFPGPPGPDARARQDKPYDSVTGSATATWQAA